MSESGGTFTVTSGVIYLLAFYFIYRDWDAAALDSVNQYTLRNSSSTKEKKNLLMDLRYRLSFSGLFILHDQVKGFEEQNYEIMTQNAEIKDKIEQEAKKRSLLEEKLKT
mgnify:CR=1 FL=1